MASSEEKVIQEVTESILDPDRTVTDGTVVDGPRNKLEILRHFEQKVADQQQTRSFRIHRVLPPGAV